MSRLGFLLITVCIAFSALSLNAQRGDPWDYSHGGNWDSSWNNRPNPSTGACFYTTANYTGNHFCVRRGQRLDRLPGNFGDNLSSIRLFGGSRVVIFNDRNFSGGSQEVRTNVRDLRNLRFRDGHTWNNRVSSVIVR